MKGHKDVISSLNEVLVGELTAINQYFLHARMCKSWGYERIAGVMFKESIEEMRHAQDLTDRILLIEGLPNFQQLGKLNIGETIKEQLKSDLELEFVAVAALRKGIALCLQHADHVSRELLEKILHDEENHIDWLESQLKIIDDIGYENYLAQQIHPGEK